MKAPSRRDRIRAQLADLKMPGALEALDQILSVIDGGTLGAPEAIENLLGAQPPQQPAPAGRDAIEPPAGGEDAERLRSSPSSRRSSASRSRACTSSASSSVRRT